VINRDTIVALFVLAVTVALYISLSAFNPDAVVFIRVIIFAIGALAMLLLVQSLLLKRRMGWRGVGQSSAVDKKDTDSRSAGFAWKPVSIIFISILVYFYVMEFLGFYVSAFFYFVVIVFILDLHNVTIKKSLIKIASAFIFTLVIYVLFNMILLVQTPRGILI